VPAIGFAPGALASLFVSTDARTFSEPPEEWKPGPWESKQSYHAGSPQSLTGDLIRAGVTGVAGYVNEPYLDASVRPDLLFPAYFAGFNLAEAFYLALPTLSWQSVIIGDPLCAPFARTAVPAGELDPPADKETELPSLFSARRIAAVGVKGDPAAVKLWLKAQTRAARDDRAGSRQALEEAVGRDDSLAVAWVQLGIQYDSAKESSKAVAAYRKAIAGNPRDWVALNNLAYIMAVTEGKPADALGLAEKALQLSGGSAVVADTVGWIKHLMGDDAGAIKILAPASKILRANADVQLHAAVVYAAMGRIDEAAAALKAAEAADPAVKSRAEFRDVQQKIGK
jgi:tetratricopeptide (TPR) repeat protein